MLRYDQIVVVDSSSRAGRPDRCGVPRILGDGDRAAGFGGACLHGLCHAPVQPVASMRLHEVEVGFRGGRCATRRARGHQWCRHDRRHRRHGHRVAEHALRHPRDPSPTGLTRLRTWRSRRAHRRSSDRRDRRRHHDRRRPRRKRRYRRLGDRRTAVRFIADPRRVLHLGVHRLDLTSRHCARRGPPAHARISRFPGPHLRGYSKTRTRSNFSRGHP